MELLDEGRTLLGLIDYGVNWAVCEVQSQAVMSIYVNVSEAVRRQYKSGCREMTLQEPYSPSTSFSKSRQHHTMKVYRI